MATYNAVGFTAPKFQPVDGCAAAIIDKTLVTAARANADIDQFMLPAGLELFTLEIQSSGTVAATVNVGYKAASPTSALAANATYFGSAKAITAGARTRLDFVPVTFNEDVIVTLTHTAAGSGTGQIFLIAEGNTNGPV
jgi:hypothetical protein